MNEWCEMCLWLVGCVGDFYRLNVTCFVPCVVLQALSWFQKGALDFWTNRHVHTQNYLLYRDRTHKPLEFHVVFLLVDSHHLANP